MLTHCGNFFCSLGGKDLFKTGFSLCEAAFRGILFCTYAFRCDQTVIVCLPGVKEAKGPGSKQSV